MNWRGILILGRKTLERVVDDLQENWGLSFAMDQLFKLWEAFTEKSKTHVLFWYLFKLKL